jgi:hypothetical protein
MLRVDQIPATWNAIKYAAASANMNKISNEELPVYLNKLLASLLNETSQCFIRLDEENQLSAIALTRINQDATSGERSLFIICLYSFKFVEEGQWKTDMEDLKSFARKSNCKRITFYSNNERIYEMANTLGFTEYYRCFTMDS